jgi:hypothetical protein
MIAFLLGATTDGQRFIVYFFKAFGAGFAFKCSSKLKDLIVKKKVLLLNFYSQNTKYLIKQSRLN